MALALNATLYEYCNTHWGVKKIVYEDGVIPEVFGCGLKISATLSVMRRADVA